ncbi:unnamed protein product, partial [Dicrocoelium dendriticum]
MGSHKFKHLIVGSPETEQAILGGHGLQAKEAIFELDRRKLMSKYRSILLACIEGATCACSVVVIYTIVRLRNRLSANAILSLLIITAPRRFAIGSNKQLRFRGCRIIGMDPEEYQSTRKPRSKGRFRKCWML